MATTLTHVAAAVAGLAIVFSPFMIAPGAWWRSWVACVGLAIVAAAIIHALAS
jgi:hypothetical protein